MTVTNIKYHIKPTVLLLPPANEVWGKVIFLHLFVILFTGGGVPETPRDQVHPPQTRYTPRDQVLPGTSQVHPPGPGTPPGISQVHSQDQVPPQVPGTPRDQVQPHGTRYTPQDQVHPPYTPPGTRYTPPGPGTLPLDQVYPPPVRWEIRSTRGRYASYWNAILFSLYILITLHSQFTRYIKRVEAQMFNICDSLDKGSVPFVTLFARTQTLFWTCKSTFHANAFSI